MQGLIGFITGLTCSIMSVATFMNNEHESICGIFLCVGILGFVSMAISICDKKEG